VKKGKNDRKAQILRGSVNARNIGVIIRRLTLNTNSSKLAIVKRNKNSVNPAIISFLPIASLSVSLSLILGRDFGIFAAIKNNPAKPTPNIHQAIDLPNSKGGNGIKNPTANNGRNKAMFSRPHTACDFKAFGRLLLSGASSGILSFATFETGKNMKRVFPKSPIMPTMIEISRPK